MNEDDLKPGAQYWLDKMQAWTYLGYEYLAFTFTKPCEVERHLFESVSGELRSFTRRPDYCIEVVENEVPLSGELKKHSEAFGLPQED